MNMKEFNKKFQAFGKSLLFPISLLSFMAIFLGIAAALQNKEIIKLVPFLSDGNLQNGLGGIRKLAGLPFTYLPLLFAISIPMGMVKRDREVAVYSSVVGYIAMLVGMSYMLSIFKLDATTTAVKYLQEKSGMSLETATLTNSLYTLELGVFVYRMNVVGGIIAGLLGVLIHNKFRNTELHNAFTFFSGKRFVPIASALIMSLVGVVLSLVWPTVNSIIMSAGQGISQSGYFGIFLYGFTEKIINPTGLHHILNQVFRFTALGGVETINGETVVGALNIYLKQLELGLPFSTEATQYLAQGKILHMVFGMPAAVLAMYRCAKPEQRKRVLQFFIPGLTAVILTGITEPIEFTFIFISPILWIMNAIFAGLAFLIPALFGSAIGNIQGGVIDWIVFGAFQGAQTKWYIFLFMGPVFFALYYFSYMFVIQKFNVFTLGRQDTDFEDDVHVQSDEVVKIADNSEENLLLGKIVVDGLGGLQNIVDVDNCISRLRIEIQDGDKVDERILKKTQPNGIVRPDQNTIHIVYGGRVTKMRNATDDYIYHLQNKSE